MTARNSLLTRQRPREASARPLLEELEQRLVLSSVPTPDHVVLVIEENHAFQEIIGARAAPYINGVLAAQGAVFNNSYGLEHPSQPNYLDLYAGNDFGVLDDSCPHSFTAPNLGGELEAAGYSFGGYSEDQPYVGYLGCQYQHYYRNGNPWSYFTDVPATDSLPFQGYFPTDPAADFSTLPTVSIVVPNTQNSMHDGRDPYTIRRGDYWLQTNLDAYVQWAFNNNSLLIVTWDEDDYLHGNQVPTLFVGPMVNHGYYHERITHFNVLRTIEDMYGLPYAGASARVNPITDIWADTGDTGSPGLAPRVPPAAEASLGQVVALPPAGAAGTGVILPSAVLGQPVAAPAVPAVSPSASGAPQAVDDLLAPALGAQPSTSSAAPLGSDLNSLTLDPLG